MDDEAFGIDNHNDPIESAGLFEGDIDNVSMDELHKIGESRVRYYFFLMIFNTSKDCRRNVEWPSIYKVKCLILENCLILSISCFIHKQ